MKLYAMDYLIIHGRYSLAIADFDTALNHYIEARLRVKCGEGYRSANQNLYSYTANFYLQKAKNRIAEIGQWGTNARD